MKFTDEVEKLLEGNMVEKLVEMREAQTDAMLCVAANGAKGGLTPELAKVMAAGLKIAVQGLSDWIVVACGGDEEVLEKLVQAHVAVLPALTKEGFEETMGQGGMSSRAH